MFNLIRNLNFFSILTIVILLVATIISLTTSFITLRDTSIRIRDTQNDLIATNYVNTLGLSFKFITSPLNYGKEYMDRYTIFNSTLDDFINLSALNNTSINTFVNSLNLYYTVLNSDRVLYENRMSELLNRPIVFTDFIESNNTLETSKIHDSYCPIFFTTLLNSRYIPGLDVCNLETYKESINALLSSTSNQVIKPRKTNNLTFLDFAINTRNGFVTVTLIIENIINAYISDNERISLEQNNQQFFTNCENTCSDRLLIRKEVILSNGELLIANIFFNDTSLDITTFLFILLLILLVVFLILFVVFNFEIQKNRYILADKMLGYVNHEIRNPLNCINGLIDLSLIQYEEDELINDKIDNEIQTDLSTAKIACELLGHIVNDILDLKNINEGKLVINNTNIYIEEFVKNLQKILTTNINEHPNIEFIFKNPENISVIFFDEQRLLQILINFITNALKHTESGSIILLIEHTPSSLVDIEKGVRKIRVSIKDTGRGIKKEEHQNIFRPFDQNNLNINPQSGIGLGLYLCKMIMDQIGGKIGFDSEFGQGSTFYIEFSEKDTLESIQEEIEIV